MKYCQLKRDKIRQKYKQKHIFYFELSSKPNFDIIYIKFSKWKKHNFETIFTSIGAINIQYGIGNVFGSIERAYSMGVNYYFGPIWKYILHAKPNNGPEKFKFEVYYYRQEYMFLQKDWLVSEKN